MPNGHFFLFMTLPVQDIRTFYTALMRDNAQGLQKKVCEANGISLHPTSGSQLVLIPVFEDVEASLLLSANIGRKITTLRFATNDNYEYVPAYYKKIRREDGRLCNEIVIATGNYCHARFFAAKELMHCFVDEDNYPATDSMALVKELIETLAIGMTSGDEVPPQTIVDELAWYGAMEYLIPSTWLPLIVKVHQNITDSFPRLNAYFHVAEMIRVPESVLRARMRAFLKE